MLNVPEDQNNSNIISHQVKSNFNGSGSEYAGIWFSNFALKIITLGIYGPWAKVRKKRYLYSSTEIAGANFDFTADPLKIFKGRAIVFAVFFLQAFLDKLSLSLAIIISLAFIVAIPWLIKKSLQFKMRYSEYRGISFRHKGSTLGVLFYLFLLNILSFISFGVLAPVVTFYKKKFIIENTQYGTKALRFNGKISELYLLYLIPVLISFSTILILGVINLIAYQSSSLYNLLSISIFIGAPVIMISFASLKYLTIKYTVDSLQIERFSFRLDTNFFTYGGILISNIFFILITLGLAYPWCFIRMNKYYLDNIYMSGNIEEINEFSASVENEISAIGTEALDLDGFDIEFGF